MEVGSISAEELIGSLRKVLESFADGDTAYRVELEFPIFTGENEFCLAPLGGGTSFEEMTGDPEYGWPQPIEAKDVTDISDVIPMRRRNPVLTVNGIPVALSLQLAEFEAMYSDGC